MAYYIYSSNFLRTCPRRKRHADKYCRCIATFELCVPPPVVISLVRRSFRVPLRMSVLQQSCGALFVQMLCAFLHAGHRIAGRLIGRADASLDFVDILPTFPTTSDRRELNLLGIEGRCFG